MAPPRPPSRIESRSSPQPIASAGQADELVTYLVEVMDGLERTIEQETEFVRAGHLSKAARLELGKSDLARHYLTGMQRLKANLQYIAQTAPEQFDVLRRRQNIFRDLLEKNLAALATAHAVSEGIIRGVSDELVRKAAPQTYGASGRPTAPSPRSAQPLAVSRVL